jgi:hypothetical protein
MSDSSVTRVSPEQEEKHTEEEQHAEEHMDKEEAIVEATVEATDALSRMVLTEFPSTYVPPDYSNTKRIPDLKLGQRYHLRIYNAEGALVENGDAHREEELLMDERVGFCEGRHGFHTYLFAFGSLVVDEEYQIHRVYLERTVSATGEEIHSRGTCLFKDGSYAMQYDPQPGHLSQPIRKVRIELVDVTPQTEVNLVLCSSWTNTINYADDRLIDYSCPSLMDLVRFVEQQKGIEFTKTETTCTRTKEYERPYYEVVCLAAAVYRSIYDAGNTDENDHAAAVLAGETLVKKMLDPSVVNIFIRQKEDDPHLPEILLKHKDHVPIRTCAEDHTLKETSAVCANDTCDFCGNRFKVGRPVFTCEICVYEICEAC